MYGEPDSDFDNNQVVFQNGTSLVNGTYTQPSEFQQFDQRLPDAPHNGIYIGHSQDGQIKWLTPPSTTGTFNLQIIDGELQWG